MQLPTHILFLPHSQINKQQWDACIAGAANSLIYGYSFYLDAMCPGWCALASPGYEWVLPLPFRKKYGISYLYQPAFMQQLGVFAKAHTQVPAADILLGLQQHFRFCEVQWNYATGKEFLDKVENIPSTNYILPLHNQYEAIKAGYSSDLLRNLKRAARFQYTTGATTDYEKCISLYRLHYGERIRHVSAADYKAFTKVCEHAAANNMLTCRQALNQQGEVLSMALLLNDGHRLYNLMNTTTPAGRKTGANHLLLDSIIREFSQSNLILDFEGSDLPGVKAFYENFSPVNQPYFMVRYNKLPWPLRWLK